MSRDGRLLLEARRRRARKLLRRRLGWVTGLLAVALAASLVSLVILIRRSSGPPLSLPTSLPPVVVEVGEEGFVPSVVIVQPGTSVRWIFRDGEHTVTELHGGWDSGARSQGAYLITLQPDGTKAAFLEYRCTLHGQMGSIHLLPPPVEPPGI